MNYKKILQNIVFCVFLSMSLQGYSQGLLDELDSVKGGTEYVENAFKSTRVVNAHSLETMSGGVLDFRISHRFGRLNEGAYEFFGLDNATIRLALEYGVSDRLMIGIGRSSFEKFYDGFIKFKLLRQSRGERNMPITLIYFGSAGINTLRSNVFASAGNYTTSYPRNTSREIEFNDRLVYTHQLILGRKFSDFFHCN